MRQTAQNTFLEGIRADHAPVDSSPSAATDIVNGTILPGKGDQMILQALKSNAPIRGRAAEDITSRTFNGQSTSTLFVDSRKQFAYISYRIDYMTPGSGGITIKVYNTGNNDDRKPDTELSIQEQFYVPGKEYRISVGPGAVPNKVVATNNAGRIYNITFKVAYYKDDVLVQLPKGNQIFGTAVHNDVAYIISGKKTDVQYTVSATNDRGAKPGFDIGFPKPGDNRDSIDNVLTNRSETTYPKRSVKLFEYSDTGWRARVKGNRTITQRGTYTLHNRLEKAGGYAANFTIKTSTDDASDIKFHTLKVRLLSGSTPINNTWYEVTDHESKALIKSFHISFNLDNPGLPLNVEYEGVYNDGGRIRFQGYIDFDFTRVPVQITSEETVAIRVEESRSATSRLHADGRITVSNSAAGTGPYWAAIGYRDFVQVPQGRAHTFSDLPPGTYPIYLKKEKDGKEYIIKDLVSVGEAYSVENIRVTAQVTNFKSVGEFKLRVSFEDFFTPYTETSANRYTVGYEAMIGTGETITEIHEVGPAQRSHTFDISLPSEGAVVAFVRTKDDHRVAGASSAYGREASVEIPVTDELGLNNYNFEIGTFPSPDYTKVSGRLEPVYRPLNNLDGSEFITDRITLSGKGYLDVELQPSYDNTVNIIYAEKGKYMRLINSGFSVVGDREYEIIDRNGSRDSNQYTSDNVELATRHVQSVSSVPTASVTGINPSGGSLEVGMYRYYIKLGTVDGNETDVVEETGFVPIFHGDTIGTIKGGAPGSRTTKSVELTIGNIDGMYDHVSLYYVLNSGEEVNVPVAYKIEKRYIIPEGTPGGVAGIVLTHSGSEPVSVVPMAELSIAQSYLKSTSTVAQVQNRLFTANIESNSLDYNKLFRAAEKIMAVPTSGFRGIAIGNLYDSWDRAISEKGFYGFSHMIYNKQLTNVPVPDLNRKGYFNGSSLLELLSGEAFYNPLVTEKLTPYWPYETYKTGVCFIMDDNTVTNPVPVSSGDFSFEDSGKSRQEWEAQHFGELMQVDFSTTNNNWTSLGDRYYNNIGVIRFPKPESPNTVFYPKFRMDKAEMMREYPEFFSRVKGFFFVRTERRPDVVLSGEIGQAFLAITEVNPLDDYGYDGYKDIRNISELTQGHSAVPAFYTNYRDWEIGTPHIRYLKLMGHELFLPSAPTDLVNAGVEEIEVPGHAFVTKGDTDYYKYIFRSGEIFSDNPRIAASFNGTSYGILPVGHFIIDGAVESVPTSVGNRKIAAAQKMLNRKMSGSEQRDIVKAVTDYIPYGTAARSGGGFSSMIPFKGSKEELLGTWMFPSGTYDSFIGLTVQQRMEATYGFLYPNATGPLSPSSIRNMYSSDESTAYVAITPRYSFSDFSEDPYIEVTGTRGDCFIVQNMINIMHGDVTPVGSPSSQRAELKDKNSGEFNSYRASEVGSVSVVVQHSNSLSFARHPEVKDAVETALHGKARGFYPLDGASKGQVAPDISNKLPSTTAFNKGYAAHFTGRKYYSVSKNSPYVASSNENTIQFSEPYVSGSFYNGYRSFSSLNRNDYNRELGPITKLVSLNNNLLSVHTRGVTLIGINDQALVQTEQGMDIRMQSMLVMSEKAAVLSSEFGSTWAGSIRKTDNAVYGVDVGRHKIWATRGEALEIISNGKVNRMLAAFLSGFQGREEVPGQLYIRTHYNTITNDVIFTFYNRDSVMTERSFGVDPDLYNMVHNMTAEERAAWVAEGSMEERLRRKEILEMHGHISEKETIKHLTLVYNEDTQTWTTRLSYSPEFAFVLDNRFYTLNSIDASSSFAGVPYLDEKQIGSHVFWEHDKVSPEIPLYGSFYGQEPRFEVEFIVNDNVKYEKVFDILHIVGNDTAPSKVLYQVSPRAPWLKTLIDTYGNDFSSWEHMKEAFYGKALDASVATVNPAQYLEQEIHDRRHNSIIRANYIHDGGFGQIRVEKNLHTMYDFSQPQAQGRKHYVSKIRDNYLRVRLVYLNGKFCYLKAVTTEYQLSH